MESQLRLVNCVGSGEVDAEIDLEALLADLEFEISYIKGPGLYVKFDPDGPTAVIARTGKYFFTGVNSIEQLDSLNSKLLELFSDLGIIDSPTDTLFTVDNMVFTADLGQKVDLNQTAILLGLEKVEYEPEQFPGLIYRPTDHECVILLFNSGRLVITGVKTKDVAKSAFNSLRDQTPGIS